MRAFLTSCLCIVLLSFSAYASTEEGTKGTYQCFTAGPAAPLSNSSAMTIPATNMKKLQLGWEGGWTFFGKPFAESGNALSGIGLGGKVNYSRWERDSTFTPVTFLGIQGIARFYTPPIIKPFDLFIQAGGGLFIGEYGFSDPDTIDWTHPDFNPIVHKGQHCLGFHLGAGVDLDVVEIVPIMTMVFTKNDRSMWLSINLGMTF